MSSAVATVVLAAIPSPDRGVWHLGPIPIRAYALCIIAGIVVAVFWGERRFVARGGEPGVVTDVAVYAVPFGLVGGRLYHVATDWQTYFGPNGNPIDAFKIWQGGLGIWGAVALGAVGAWIGCRRRGVPLPFFADAVAPGIVTAQAIGRLGNWFNQELYGAPTTLPWGLEIYRRVNPDTGVPDSLGGVALDRTPIEIVHPTFLYELLWNLAVAALVVWADRRFRLGHGRAFAVYVAGYTAGRFWIEQMRTDYATRVFGDLRINVVVAAVVFLGAVLYLLVVRKPREEPPTADGADGGASRTGDPERGEEEPLPVGAGTGQSAAGVASAALEKVVRPRRGRSAVDTTAQPTEVTTVAAGSAGAAAVTDPDEVITRATPAAGLAAPAAGPAAPAAGVAATPAAGLAAARSAAAPAAGLAAAAAAAAGRAAADPAAGRVAAGSAAGHAAAEPGGGRAATDHAGIRGAADAAGRVSADPAVDSAAVDSAAVDSAAVDSGAGRATADPAAGPDAAGPDAAGPAAGRATSDPAADSAAADSAAADSAAADSGAAGSGAAGGGAATSAESRVTGGESGIAGDPADSAAGRAVRPTATSAPTAGSATVSEPAAGWRAPADAAGADASPAHETNPAGTSDAATDADRTAAGRLTAGGPAAETGPEALAGPAAADPLVDRDRGDATADSAAADPITPSAPVTDPVVGESADAVSADDPERAGAAEPAADRSTAAPRVPAVDRSTEAPGGPALDQLADASGDAAPAGSAPDPDGAPTATEGAAAADSSDVDPTVDPPAAADAAAPDPLRGERRP